MSNSFYGREEQIQDLERLWAKRTSSLVTRRGLRRHGKEPGDGRRSARKVALVPTRRGVSLRTALVYDGELAPIVEADGYFDALIPFRKLLGV